MRKLVLMLTVLVSSIVFMAGAGENPFVLKSGSLRSLKDSGGTITVEMDFSRTRANRKPFEQYIVEDYGSTVETFERYKPEMLEWFCDRWDDDIEEGPRAIRREGGAFRLVLIIKTLNLGVKSGLGGGASASGYAEFYRKDETEPFAVVEMLKFYGTSMGGCVPGFPGLKQTFNDMAEYLCDTIYHGR